MNGFLLIDKNKGETSFDVVKRVRKEFGVKKVGHAGTLDPLATGLMIVAVGEATKLLEYLLKKDKVYEVKAKFGYESDTYDAEGEISEIDTATALDKKSVQEVVEKSFIGEIDQVPPKYSALKVEGKRAYKLAREGKEFVIKKRKVKVVKFEILDFNYPEVDFKVECSSGTYIRSLVHDLGREMGVGAYVQELRRTKIDDWVLSKKNEHSLVAIERFFQGALSVKIDEGEFNKLVQGQFVLGKKVVQDELVFAEYQNRFVAVLENTKDGEGIKMKKRIYQ